METEEDTDDVVNASRPIPASRFQNPDYRDGYTDAEDETQKRAEEYRTVDRIIWFIYGGVVIGCIVWMIHLFSTGSCK